MEFRILGPLDVRNGDQAVELAGGRQRALLALLIVNANETVSTDRIVEELWGAQSPQTAPKVIQNHVSQLRRGLGDGLLVTEGSGYRLRVDPGSLDVDLFEKLLADGRRALERGDAESSADLLRESLALWRGSPLADVAFEPFAQAEVARLEERRLVAVEERIEADLMLGRHDDLVGELESLIDRNPLRERLRALLMLALYRSGRQSEALTAYQEARGALVEELGIEPARALRDLQQSILNQDACLDLPAAAELPAEGPRGAFVGRETELAVLLDPLADALSGRGGLVLLVGEPGAGKSRLADETIAQARARGVEVLVGHCWEAGGAPAYWPWVQSLRGYMRDADPSSLREQLGTGAADLAQMLPELREKFDDLPEPPGVESEGARFSLFDATAQFLRRASNAQPVLLFIDDLHAADVPSLLLLQFLARELRSMRMLVVAAYRDVDPIPGGPLTETIGDLARQPVATSLKLTGLAKPEVAAYVDLTASEIASPELIAALHQETEGNPLFVVETVRLMAIEGVGHESGPTEVAIPDSVHAVIGRRLAHLSDECNRVLTVASVLGREFALDVLARFGDMSEDGILDVLDEAMVARVVAEVPGERGSLRFAHVLIRDTLYEGLMMVRRVQMHRQAVEALEALYGDDSGAHLAELAHHSIEGSEFDKALRYARRAADRALALLAYEEAARLYRMALEAVSLASPTAANVRCELLLALGEAETDAGDGPAARGTFLRAAEIARNLQSWEQLARAAVGYSGRDLWGPRAEGEPMLVPLLEEALAECPEGDSVLHAKLLSRLASALRGAVDREEPASLARKAVEMAARIGDQTTVLHALGSKMAATRGPDNIDEGLADGLEVVSLAEELGEPELVFYGHDEILYSAWILGDRGTVSTGIATMRQLAEQSRQPSKAWSATAWRALGRSGRVDSKPQRSSSTRPFCWASEPRADRSPQLPSSGICASCPSGRPRRLRGCPTKLRRRLPGIQDPRMRTGLHIL